MEKINQGQDDGVDDRNFENKNPMTSVLNDNADKKMISNHVISKDSKDQNDLKRKLEEIEASLTEVDNNAATPATDDDDKETKMSGKFIQASLQAKRNKVPDARSNVFLFHYLLLNSCRVPIIEQSKRR